MIVCPNCRNVNPEEAQTCANCGRTLEPGPSHLGGARRSPGERPSLDVTPLPQRSTRKGVALLSLVIGVAAGFLAFRLFRTDPCEGRDFTSDLYGYCVNVPAGWEAGQAQREDVAFDRFSPAAGTTTVLVEAIDLPSGSDAATLASVVRQKDQAAGFDLGASRTDSVGGEAARIWDTTFTDDRGQTFKMTEVVVVRGELGWRIAFSDSADHYASTAGKFRQLLDSWRFT